MPALPACSAMRTVAALFVEANGIYAGLPGVDAWDINRDARSYPGPHPVVCHSPCTRWCRLAGLVEARWGHKRGDDGGCFEAALSFVRRYGGVLEHPAYSDAWPAFNLAPPNPSGGWQRAICGGWSTHVEQSRYGHAAKKATWLYAYGIDAPPSLDWRRTADGESTAQVSWCGNHTSKFDKRPRIGKKAASATPIAFRDLLLSIARNSHPAAGRSTERSADADKCKSAATFEKHAQLAGAVSPPGAAASIYT